MGLDFHTTAHPDMVQRALPFETAKCSLHRLPLLREGFPLRRLNHWLKLGTEPLMTRVYVYDGLCRILTADKVYQCLPGVTLICQDIDGSECRWGLSHREAGLLEHIGGSLRVMDVTRADVGRYGKLILSVHQKMQFVAKNEFSLALGSLLDAPCGLSIRGFWLTTIHPSFEGGAVQGNSQQGERFSNASCQSAPLAFNYQVNMQGAQ